MNTFFSQKKSRTDEQGNVLIIVMVLFVAISLSIAMGLVAPVLRANRIATNNLESKRSYFIAESGVEDVYYRMLHSMQVSTSENLVLGTQSATTTLADITGGDKEIVAVGDANNRNRTLTTILEKGIGNSFQYGMQSGFGGLTMANGSGVNGSVYSNGHITGSGFVTGSATSANTANVVADQQNGTGTPPNNAVFGTANSTQDLAQSFQVSATEVATKVRLYIRKNGNPSNVTVRIVNDAGGSPGVSTLTSGSLAASLVSTTYGWVDVIFAENPTLTSGTSYWVVIDGATSATNYYTIGANNSYINGTAKIGQYGGSWNSTTPADLDIYFSFFIGGSYGLIDGITVGTGLTGNAYAHTVNNSTIAGTNYCQSGSNNNKACNTTFTDPVAIPMPISEQNIMDWKDEAAAGGTHSGNYAVSGTTMQLGPKKITGDLTLGINSVFTVTGTLWVEGNIVLGNGSTIKLASSYSSGSGVVIADGTISLQNNGASGSGTNGSYIMLLSTSTSTSAINVGNNAGSAILYAANGTVNVSNNASAKEINGYKINLSNNAVITYDTGLTNINFTNGPSGSWTIQSWRETE